MFLWTYAGISSTKRASFIAIEYCQCKRGNMAGKTRFENVPTPDVAVLHGIACYDFHQNCVAWATARIPLLSRNSEWPNNHFHPFHVLFFPLCFPVAEQSRVTSWIDKMGYNLRACACVTVRTSAGCTQRPRARQTRGLGLVLVRTPSSCSVDLTLQSARLAPRPAGAQEQIPCGQEEARGTRDGTRRRSRPTFS